MATTTQNLGLIKPAGTDKIRIAQINSNMDTIDTKMGPVGSTPLQTQATNAASSISALQKGMAIVCNGNTHAAIASGQFVYVRNHGSLSEGLYTATADIAANGALSNSNLSAVASGGLNALNSKLANKTPYAYDTAGTPVSADTLDEGMFFGVLTQATSPDGSANYWFVITMPRSTGIQIVFAIGGAKMYVRPRTSRTWGAWKTYTGS